MKADEFLQGVRDGVDFEVHRKNIQDDLCWSVPMNDEQLIRIYTTNSGRVRIKEKVKTVDMSPMVGSGLDCWFDTASGATQISKLERILDNGYFDDGVGGYPACRPRLNEWLYWNGGVKSPIPEGVSYIVRRRDGEQSPSRAVVYSQWDHGSRTDDIIAVKFIGLELEWQWPGET